MPLDPSISLQAKGVDLPNALSGFLDLGAKKLQLEKARQTFAADVAQRQAESSSSQSRATVDAANVNPLIEQQQAATDIAKLGAQGAKTRLSKEQATIAFDQAAALATNPDIIGAADSPDKAIVAIGKARRRAEASGVPPEIADVMFGHLTAEAKGSPQTLVQTLNDILKGGLGASGQAGAMYPNPALVNNGQQLQPIAPGNPALTGVTPGTVQGQGVQMQLPPTALQPQPGPADARGNPTVIGRDAQGRPVQQPMPQTQGPLQFPPGENAETYKQLSGERDAGRQTVLQAPTIHKLNEEILSELEKATTGQYAGIIAKAQSVAGMLGMSVTGNNEQERAASAYDLVDKYTTMAATRAAQSMGNDTATALNAQLKQNASVERNPTAIKKSIKFNDAVLAGAEAYQRGLEASIAKNPQADVFVKRQFDQAWAQNFDPAIMQIYQAKKSGDKAELADLVKGLGNRAPEIMLKAKNLQKLMQSGM